FLPALLAQTLGLSHKTVRGWRQVAIAAVFRKPRLQGLHSLGEGSDLLLHLLDQGIPLCQLLTQRGDLLFLLQFSFFWAHVATLHIFRLSGKSVGNLSSYGIYSSTAEPGEPGRDPFIRYLEFERQEKLPNNVYSPRDGQRACSKQAIVYKSASPAMW